jgi:hypothetical protein
MYLTGFKVPNVVSKQEEGRWPSPKYRNTMEMKKGSN